MRAEDIVNRAEKIYANSKSYVDVGEVQETLGDEEDNSLTLVVKPFSTAFVRPESFRFEYYEEGYRNSTYIIWQKGHEVRSWWGIKQAVVEEKKLELALAKATGVSGVSAHLIPSLLLPSRIDGRFLDDLKSGTRAEDESIMGRKCFTITGTYSKDPMKVWIEKDTYLIRRIEFKVLGSSKVNHVLTYDPSIDVPVTGEQLDFRKKK